MLQKTILFTCLGIAWSRDTSKVMKSMPAISDSLVNFGKMDISFYINGKPQGLEPTVEPKQEPLRNVYSQFSANSLEEPCPCSSLDSFRTHLPSLAHPSEILNKILSSNDLFSSNKEVVTSPTCCSNSHEHVGGDDVVLEFGPKPVTTFTPQTLPFIFDMFNKPYINSVPYKPKAVEIFFFPKQKTLDTIDFGKVIPAKKKETTKKEVLSDITIVGGKELQNDFKKYDFRPPLQTSSVKKDLTLQEKPVKDIITEKPETDKTVVTSSSTIPNSI